ncbi:MAG TPA: ABC transporter ATP-binding protein, partial [Clostridia bacterium]|nr:ABC transporter ATP-binding protein [Clostridia bacterium]
SKLKVEEISKNFSGLKAVDNVSFSLQTGEILGLIGPNGSGKTTIINMVTGLMKPTSGRILVDDRDLTRNKRHHFAREGLARTFQTIRLFKKMTVFENVEVSGVSMGKTRKEAALVAYRLLEMFELSDYADRESGTLDHGNQRRIEIARALALDPKFLFLDEPAAGLNEEESDALLDMLKDFPIQMNLGMLIVDHDMRLIMRLCSKLHVLDHGQTIAEGLPSEIRKNAQVMEAYFGSKVGV